MPADIPNAIGGPAIFWNYWRGAQIIFYNGYLFFQNRVFENYLALFIFVLFISSPEVL